MDMVIIESSTELIRVQNCIAANGGFVGDVWIGGFYDVTNSVHRWVDNTMFNWTNWESSEPNCLQGTAHWCGIDEDCVRINTAYEFRTKACTVPYDVLCEKADGLLNCVDPSTTSMTSTTKTSITKDNGLPLSVIIGLAVGFGGFIASVTLCCITWKIFCGNGDDDKISPEPEGIVNINISKNSTQDIAKENPWLKDEEISFCLRDKYTFEFSQELTGKRTKYMK
ncbi:unnamed protein product [Mytilus coruscus]|uniref:C-type lectin domain-containing protein n=1 Tax=Mytilus coruscus TaxID=42192 RepID=A0A6J8DT50_MYTCO|nr:unnamed protein product [Mytilus coruscus]